MKSIRIAATVMAVTLLQACGSDVRQTDNPRVDRDTGTAYRDDATEEDYGCPQEIRPGIVVEIRDAVTNAALADSAMTLVTEGEYRTGLAPGDLVEIGGPISQRSGVYERPGTYALRVTRVGYQPWERSGIEVLADRCGVRTVEIEVMLVPEH